jgi:hypothetical protein
LTEAPCTTRQHFVVDTAKQRVKQLRSGGLNLVELGHVDFHARGFGK